MTSLHRSLRRSISKSIYPTSSSCYALWENHSSRDRLFSSTSKDTAIQDRLARTLYRQLLRWCQDTGGEIPLTPYVPPVTTMPPVVNERSLKRLSDGQEEAIREFLPRNSIIQRHHITVPIRRASDIGNLLKAIFRMNDKPSTAIKEQKERISVAMKTLKSLNELTEALQEVQQEREKHLDREGIKMSIGQMVQHKTERWRGVILGWERIRKKQHPEAGFTSLTTKGYNQSNKEDDENETDPDNEIQYTVILDSGDAHLTAGRHAVHGRLGHALTSESDLELLQDVALCRIRGSLISRYFERFDATSKCFVPNEAHEYLYPLDVAHLNGDELEQRMNTKRNEIGNDIVQAIQRFSSRLQRVISNGNYTCNSHIMNNFNHRLSRLAVGDVLTEEDRLTNPDINGALLATLHLRWFLNMTLELAELIWERRIAKESMDNIKFCLGDIVQHKLYGYRGVVVAWDPKPAVDVSLWDGLSDVENPNEKPFYHIIPDQNDCLQQFGGERPFRYACEENLELCPRHRTILEVDMDPEWDIDTETKNYTPPEELKFKHGEDIGDDNVTEQFLEEVHNEIRNLYLAQRGFSENLNQDLIDIAKVFSLDTLFQFLKLANNLDTAVAAEESIKELWKAHPDASIRFKLDQGVADLLGGNKEKALVVFQELAVEDPNYAEAWNKASTCYFMLGDMQSSLEAAEQAISLLPKHFQAVNGLGLIQYETRRYKLAAASFRQSLEMDPWSPVASRLASCMDLLIGGDLEDEIKTAKSKGPYD
mmetsp:Transcript_11436/g.16772  ORF Transcript_11436/g.16772 Transcript_11436/m.16772 type:complete len:766 (+) Transcript_11436:197-2494(+)